MNWVKIEMEKNQTLMVILIKISLREIILDYDIFKNY